MDPVTALILACIATHYIMKAAAQAGRTQTRTELGRAREAIRTDLAGRRSAAAARLRERLAAGQRTGPRNGWWWAWAALQARSALRAVRRQPRRPAEERDGDAGRPTTGPIGRILGAMWRGGVYAWEDIRRQREENRRQRPAEPPDVGVCERCGAVVATAALADGATRQGRAARMCARCRALSDAERQADAQAAADTAADTAAEAPDVADAEIVPPALGAGGFLPPLPERTCYWCGHTASTGMQPYTREPGKWECADPQACRRRGEDAEAPGWGTRCGAAYSPQCVRCGSVLDRFCCTNAACELAWRSISPPLPGEGAVGLRRFALPVRMCPNCSTQLVPSTWHAVNATNTDVCLFCARDCYPEGATRPRQDVELAALGRPVDADGNPVALHPGQYRAIGQEAARIATVAAAGPHGPCSLCGCPLDAARCCACCDGPAPQDSPPDSPAGPQALPPASATTEGDNVTCEMHSQAGWAAAAESVQQQVKAITESAENMLRCLSSKNAGRGHIAAAAGWKDRVATVLSYAGTLIAEVNDHQDPYVDAVQGAGGSEEVADPDFYDEI